jgi:hypothetical protein
MQMSEGELHHAMGLQVPSAAPLPEAPWQLFVQQSAAYAHASPSVVQGPTMASQTPPVQVFEQHCESSAQTMPEGRHGAVQMAPAVPALGQLSPQH